MARKVKEYLEIELESALNYLGVDELEMLERDAALKDYMVRQRSDNKHYYYSAIVDGKTKYIKTSIHKHIVVEAAIEYNRKQSA